MRTHAWSSASSAAPRVPGRTGTPTPTASSSSAPTAPALVGTRDGTVLRLAAGETVWTLPGADHGHGGRADQMMRHHAILDETEAGDATTWLEPVTDVGVGRVRLLGRQAQRVPAVGVAEQDVGVREPGLGQPCLDLPTAWRRGRSSRAARSGPVVATTIEGDGRVRQQPGGRPRRRRAARRRDVHGPGADGSTWTDFGVGLAHLDLPACSPCSPTRVQHRNPRHVVDVEPASSCRSHTPAGTGRLAVGPGVVRVTR